MKSPHIAKPALNRRHFLKGIGSAVALPFLDAMNPVFAQSAGVSPRRFVSVCTSLGLHGPYLFPKTEGKDYEMTPYLSRLKQHKEDFTLFSGLSHPEQNGNNGHASELTWLTSAPRPGLAGFKNSISLDQRIAQNVGNQTRFPSLVLGTRKSSLAWSENGVQIPSENSPAKLFKEMFVEGNEQEKNEQMRRIKSGQSILDTVSGQASRLQSKLAYNDKEKIEEYLTAVRELEVRLQENEGWVHKPKPKVEKKQPRDVADKKDQIARQNLMYEMIALAIQTDSTRVVSFKIGGENHVISNIKGVKRDWHNLSHHGKDKNKIDELKLIEQAQLDAFSKFLTKLKGVKENGKSILDHTAVLYGSNLGNASAHDWRNLPVFVAGGGYDHQGYLNAGNPKNNQPLANLFVSMAQRMGVSDDKFGSSEKTGIKGFDFKG